jgi:hypothetical protein
MAESGLSGVIERLKTEGQLTRNNGTNSIKSISVKVDAVTELLKSIDQHIMVQSRFMEIMVSELSTMNSEINELITDAARARATDSVRGTRTGPTEESAEPRGREAGERTEPVGLDLLSLGGLTASVIGAAIGMMQGQLRAINFFTVGKFQKVLDALSGKIVGVIDDIGDTVVKGFKGVRNTVAAGLIAAAQILDFSKDSKFLSIITQISSIIGYVVKPFSDAAKMISGWIDAGKRVAGAFSTIGGFLGEFGQTITRVSGIVGKLFYPITVLIAAYDTVTGIIDGYQEGGILGALEGGITGLFNSLIFGPLDLLKDMTSWVVGMLGFDKAAEALDSFSFSEIFNTLVGGIFDLGSTVVNWAIDSFKGIASGLGDLWGWVGDTWESVSNSIGEKFTSFANFLGGIPDAVWMFAQEMFIDVSAKLKKGFIMFGDWLASLPARIKLSALSTIRDYDPTGLLVSEEDVTAAQAAVSNRSSDTNARLAAVDVETATRRQQLADRYANNVQNDAATSRNNVLNAPTVNNGGNTTNNTSSSTTIINSSPHQSLNAFMPI